MKHHNKTRIFHREKKSRDALIVSLVRSLVLHGSIETSVAKAKTIRPVVEKLVTAAKKNTLASKRLVMSRVMNDEDVMKKLHSDLAPKFASRAGGYTRITKMGATTNVDHDTATISFVE